MAWLKKLNFTNYRIVVVTIATIFYGKPRIA